MPNNKTTSVSIVIPAFNEEKTVANVIKAVNRLPYVSEVIVVDDGSYDKTVEEAGLAGADIISHAKNMGKGSAIKTGFKHSKGDIVAFIDADIENLDSSKVDMIIRPILEGKTDITKTKFMRESGRVTELTAKPLLKFFFPEINFKQPLSGQFAGKRAVLEKIKFEKDYGVDVGIVLDADAHGINIIEVDIGEIKHDMSPLENLHEMANEVTRTIVDRAMEYGRVTMMDTMGNYIRMATLGLSLIILGLFTIFFVQFVPLELGVVITAIGIILTLYYVVRLFIKTMLLFKKRQTGNFFRSFIKMHFPVVISAFVLLLMISTFLSAAHISDGKISIEPTSRTLVIFPGSPDQTIYVRGPYTIDSALENQSTLIRMPQDAMNTLEIKTNDRLLIDEEYYIVNISRPGEENVLRAPLAVQRALDIEVGDVISDGNIKGVFEGVQVEHAINTSNLTQGNNSTENVSSEDVNENYISGFVNSIINSRAETGVIIDVSIDNKHVESIKGVFINNTTYNIYVDGYPAYSFTFDKNNTEDSYVIYYGEHIIEVKMGNSTSAVKRFIPAESGPFMSFYFVNS